MKKHIFKIIFILALSSISFYTKLTIPYLIVFTSLVSFINPLYSLSLMIPFYFILEEIYFLYYIASILLINLSIFIKSERLRNVLIYIILIALTSIYYLNDYNVVNLVLITLVLSLLIIILNLPFIKDNYLDIHIILPLFYAISLSFLYYAEDKTLPSLILSSTISNSISFIILPFLLFYQGFNLNYITIILLIVPSIRLTKNIYPFFTLYLGLAFILYYLSPIYLFSLIFPAISFLFMLKKKRIL